MQYIRKKERKKERKTENLDLKDLPRFNHLKYALNNSHIFNIFNITCFQLILFVV